MSAVVERTCGVPLFVEELTRALLERGDARSTGREIPATLHDSLIARLDRLGPARETLQIGAILGTNFSYELLHAVHPAHDHDELQGHLRTLADAELLYVRGLAPDATYQFKHALIRDAAYEALLKKRRKELHRLVAQTIDSQFATLKENHPEVLARHWTEAGEIEPAISEWTRAARSAEFRNAFTEALHHYDQALALILELPESRERDARELGLRQSAFGTLRVVRGFSVPETMAALDRAAVLAEKIGTTEQVIVWLRARCLSEYVGGALVAAGVYGDRALELANRGRDSPSVPHIQTLQMLIRFYRGDLAGCEKHFQDGLPYFGDPDFRQSALGGSVIALSAASWNAWLMGRTDAARVRAARVAKAAEGNRPQNIAFAHYGISFLHSLTRNYAEAEAAAARALRLSEEHGFSYFASLSRTALGYAQALLGGGREALDLLRRGIHELIATKAILSVSIRITWLVEALVHENSPREALEEIRPALQADIEELALRPETLRVRGEIQLKLDRPGLAETDFRDSIALAQSMNAKAWELRTTLSLARLLASTNRCAEARTILSSIYNWFTEGFDSPDLIDAKSLLHELSA